MAGVRGARRGYMKIVLRLLSERGCVSYDEVVEAGVPRDTVHIYAIRLARSGIAVRKKEGGRGVLCIKLLASSGGVGQGCAQCGGSEAC
jgi:hypothetical protein